MRSTLPHLHSLLVQQHKQGALAGIPSICSAHPVVLKEALRPEQNRPVLIESTCNQVNQFGGYTGMTPGNFVAYVRNIASQTGFPVENIILGGDHLGPNVWQNEPSNVAMQKSVEMVQAYVRAGYTKIHLDCSIRLADDPAGALDPAIIAQRAARLAQAAEKVVTGRDQTNLQYVIGTEVPVPGGALNYEEGVRVTRASDAADTLDIHRQAFFAIGLTQAWERVIAIVVQPGVEFGDDFVLPYQPDAARDLSSYIEKKGMVYEAHSTDYQTRTALHNLVRDHFAILKVGPALTFAYREAVFALAMMENEMVPSSQRSNIIAVLDSAMVHHPEHWQKYYSGSPDELAFKRKFSLSDRIRYYWVQPEVQDSLTRLMKNLSARKLPISLVSQFAPQEKSVLMEQGTALTPENIISARISQVLDAYRIACEKDANQ
jgi:D-tagatose-1,6-bisphosphate aldolase subunit GatZ/KbaZ